MEKDSDCDGLQVTLSKRQQVALLLPDDVNTDTDLGSLAIFRHFAAAVHAGIQPDERVMKAIAKVFGNYICQHQPVGEPKKFKSLDECFTLKPKQRVGHPVNYTMDRAKRMMFLYQMYKYRVEPLSRGEKPKLDDSAELAIDSMFLSSGETYSVDTLTRYYTEIGGDEFFKKNSHLLFIEM